MPVTIFCLIYVISWGKYEISPTKKTNFEFRKAIPKIWIGQQTFQILLKFRIYAEKSEIPHTAFFPENSAVFSESRMSQILHSAEFQFSRD